MLKNEEQYRVTEEQAERLSAQLAKLRDMPEARRDPSWRAQVAALDEDLRKLDLELTVFRLSHDNAVNFAMLGALETLGAQLVAARVSQGMTQAMLAERLGKHEQAVQRYEKTGYRAASLETLCAVARALGEEIGQEPRIAAAAL